jgi:hypothetical protein
MHKLDYSPDEWQSSLMLDFKLVVVREETRNKAKAPALAKHIRKATHVIHDTVIP